MFVREVLRGITDEPDITTVEDVARIAGVSVRVLQRLFSRHVGASPKWVLRRQRLIEAARRLEAGQVVSFAELFTSLGYFDQAHFIKDFKAMVGKTPAAFARIAGPR